MAGGELRLGTTSWEGGEEWRANSHESGSCRHGVLSLDPLSGEHEEWSEIGRSSMGL